MRDPDDGLDRLGRLRYLAFYLGCGYAATYVAGQMQSGAVPPDFSRSLDVYDAQGEDAERLEEGARRVGQREDDGGLVDRALEFREFLDIRVDKPLLGAIPAGMVALSISPEKFIWVIIATTIIQ